MSKELEALERIENGEYFVDFELDAKIGEDYEEEIAIIKTALKRLEQLEEENKFLRANIENLDETYFETWRVCEELKKNSNYALMFIDNIYCLVNTKDNKFDVIDNYEINSKGIIENKEHKALKVKNKPHQKEV